MNDRLAALDFIAACLSVMKTDENTATLERDISSGCINWERVIELANTNLISPTLWAELHSSGLANNVPVEVQDYLGEVHRLNSLRNKHLKDQVIEVVRAFNSIGVVPILLKGAVSLFAQTYNDPGSRVMTDIDILVPRNKTEECWNLLCTLGYSALEDNIDYSRHNHLRPLSRQGEYAVIEIHRDALPSVCTSRFYGTCLSQRDTERITKQMCSTAESLMVEDTTMSMPSPTFRILHCLLHSALKEDNAYRSGSLPLKSLHELALMQRLFDEVAKWDLVSQMLEFDRKLNISRTWMYFAHRLFGSSLPSNWKITPRMVMHYARCRLQARWGLSVTFRHISQT